LNKIKEQDLPPAPQKGEEWKISQSEQNNQMEPEKPGQKTEEPGPGEQKPQEMTQPGEEEKLGEKTSQRDPRQPVIVETPSGGLIEAIIAAYNRILPELPAASGVTSSREKAVKRRIKENTERNDLSWWERYFSLVRQYPWLMGNNPSGWRAAFDWLVGDVGMQKVIEGCFSRAPKMEHSREDLWEWQQRYTNERGILDAKALLRDWGEWKSRTGAA
jgi:hypothetical protein